MKEAVATRNAFAAAHSGYIVSLKNTGAALNDYGQGEAIETPRPGVAVVAPIFSDPLPPAPPPPPLPPLADFQRPPPPSPLKRTHSAPPIQQQPEARKPPEAPAPSIVEEEEDEDEEEEEEEEEHVVEVSEAVRPPPPPPLSNNPPPPPPAAQNSSWDFFDNMLSYTNPEPQPSVEEPEHHDHDHNHDHGRDRDRAHVYADIKKNQQNHHRDDETATDTDTDTAQPGTVEDSPVKMPEKSAAAMENKIPDRKANHMQLSVPSDRGGAKGGGKELLKVLAELDDHFLSASESGYEVSKMLEANRLHYHSNFADNKGTINHSEQVMRVITWNSSFKGPYGSEDGNDDVQGKEKETHASVLDKLLAWENKLYDEVKAGELMKIEYQKKIASLNKQKKRGRNSEALEKTKAAVKYLHTRYMVDFQAMDSTSSEIQRLRDEQLYPNLVELVEGMEKMWKSMYDCHCYQEKIVADLRFDTSNAPEETTKQHHERTLQLQRVANEWHTQSEKLFIHQKQYIDALNNWLRLNLIPIESNLKEKVSSPLKTVVPPIYELLQQWHGLLDQLPYAVALQGIKSFAAIISRIVSQQQEELKHKKSCEEVRVEFEKKERAFREWERQRNRGSEEHDGTEAKNDGVQAEANNKDPFHERKIAIEALKKKVEEEDAKHKRACKSTRDISLRSLETGLPALFHALVGLSRNCSEIYKELHLVTLKYKPSENEQ